MLLFVTYLLICCLMCPSVPREWRRRSQKASPPPSGHVKTLLSVPARRCRERGRAGWGLVSAVTFHSLFRYESFILKTHARVHKTPQALLRCYTLLPSCFGSSGARSAVSARFSGRKEEMQQMQQPERLPKTVRTGKGSHVFPTLRPILNENHFKTKVETQIQTRPHT